MNDSKGERRCVARSVVTVFGERRPPGRPRPPQPGDDHTIRPRTDPPATPDGDRRRLPTVRTATPRRGSPGRAAAPGRPPHGRPARCRSARQAFLIAYDADPWNRSAGDAGVGPATTLGGHVAAREDPPCGRWYRAEARPGRYA